MREDFLEEKTYYNMAKLTHDLAIVGRDLHGQHISMHLVFLTSENKKDFLRFNISYGHIHSTLQQKTLTKRQ